MSTRRYADPAFEAYEYGFGNGNDQDVEGTAEFYRKGGVDSSGGTTICDSEYWPGFECDSNCVYVTEVESYETIAADAASIVRSIVAGVGVVTATETVESERTTTTAASRTICVNDGTSFFFLFLTLPCLVYLFFKPVSNALVNGLCPPEPLLEEREDELHMESNPAYGIERNDQRAATHPKRAPTPRGKIDMTLNKKKSPRKKKKAIGEDEFPAAAEPKRSATLTEHDLYGKVESESAPSIVSGIAGSGTAQFSNPVLAVYSGDDWQEHVADAAIACLCCRTCKRPTGDAPEPAPHPKGEML